MPNVTMEEINKYVDGYVDEDYFDVDYIKEYLMLHDMVGRDFFMVSGHARFFTDIYEIMMEKEDMNFYHEDFFKMFEPETVEEFLRTIPVYFYTPEMSNFKKPVEPLFGHVPNVESASLVEILFYVFNGWVAVDEFRNDFVDDCESVSYIVHRIVDLCEKTNMSYCDMFSYIKSQTDDSARAGSMFMNWLDYLDLCIKYDSKEYFPDRFITAYNFMRIKVGMEPIIYNLYGYDFLDEYSIFNEVITFEGSFPCDEEGNPYMEWIGIKALDSKNITCTCKASNEGKLNIEILPTTQVFVKRNIPYHTQESALQVINGHCKDMDIQFENLWEFYDYLRSTDEGKALERQIGTQIVKELTTTKWERVYAGPYYMEFSPDVIKTKRKILGYTQREVADAIGASHRTYQKWENGESIPDGHYLMRLISWLRIDNIQDLVQYRVEPVVGCDDSYDLKHVLSRFFHMGYELQEFNPEENASAEFSVR